MTVREGPTHEVAQDAHARGDGRLSVDTARGPRQPKARFDRETGHAGSLPAGSDSGRGGRNRTDGLLVPSQALRS